MILLRDDFLESSLVRSGSGSESLPLSTYTTLPTTATSRLTAASAELGAATIPTAIPDAAISDQKADSQPPYARLLTPLTLQHRYADLPPSSPLRFAYDTLRDRNLLDIFQRPVVDSNPKEKAPRKRHQYGVGAEGLSWPTPVASDFDPFYARSLEYQTKVEVGERLATEGLSWQQ
jgi:hypothetical protein